MYSFVISLLNKDANLDKIASDIRLDYGEDAEVIFFGNKKHKAKNFIYYCVGEEKNEDKILNAIIPTIKGNELVLIRSSFDLKNYVNIKKLEKQHQNGADIVLFKRKQKNTFWDKIKFLFNKLNKIVMGHNLFLGDLSVVLFGEVSTDVLKHLQRPSIYTKVEKWIGQKIEYVELDVVDKYLPQKSFKRQIVIILICLAIIGLSVGLLFLPAFSRFYLALLDVVILLSAFVIVLLFIWRIIIINKIGRTEFEIFDLKKGE